MIEIPNLFIQQLAQGVKALPGNSNKGVYVEDMTPWQGVQRFKKYPDHMCLDQSPQRFNCTEPKGHEGFHYATSSSHGYTLCCPGWKWEKPVESDEVIKATITSFGKNQGAPEGMHPQYQFSALKVHNPWRDDALRKLNGLDERVQERLLRCGSLRATLINSVNVINHALASGMDSATKFGFFCYGGKHRSVVLAEMLPVVWAELVKLEKVPVVSWQVVHRDLKVKS